MLAVDPFKRITVDEIFNHPWFTPNLAPYLAAYPHAPGPVLGTLSSLVGAQKRKDYIVIPGIGRIEDIYVQELAVLIALTKEEIWLALKREGANSIKVTYALIRDTHRQNMQRTCPFFDSPQSLTSLVVSEYAEEERDLQIAQIAGVNPNIHLQTEPEPGAISPPVVLPGAPGDVELNPFEERIPEEGLEGEEEDEDYYSDESESDIDLGGEPEPNSFAVLHTSLPGHTESPSGVPGQLRPLLGMPHLSSSSSNKRGGATSAPVKERKSKMRWHFGIRSRSPPMEVMLEIYETLTALGFQWREKKGVWGMKPRPPQNHHDLNDSIYLIETRVRVRDIVVRISSRSILRLSN